MRPSAENRWKPLFLALLISFFSAAESRASGNPDCPWLLYPVSAKRLATNLEAAGLVMSGISKEDYNYLAFQGIGVIAERDPKAKELLDILLSEQCSDPKVLKSSLDDWLTRYTSWKGIAFPDDIRRFGDSALRDGVLGPPTNGWVQWLNGYIEAGVYSLLVSKGLFPAGDPHDLLAHLLSLTDTRFNDEFVRQMNLTYDSWKKLGFPKNPRALTASTENPWTIAHAKVYSQIQGFVRDGTQENWTYLVHGEDGSTRLFGQGNKPYVGYTVLLRGDSRDFIRRLLNGEYWNAIRDVEALPAFESYLHDERRAQIYAQYREALLEQGADLQQLSRVTKELKDLIPTYWDDMGPHSEAEAMKVMKSVVGAFQRDPYLRKMFSRESRLRLYSASNEFYQSYLHFVETSLSRATP